MRRWVYFISLFSFLSLHAQDYLLRLNNHVAWKNIEIESRPLVAIPHPFFDAFRYVKNPNIKTLDSLVAVGILGYWEPPRKQTLHYIPSDVKIDQQWYLEDLGVYEAWDIARGDTSFVIAILDSGVDYSHEDLSSQLAYNTADPINGIDDDYDGYIDNYYGWDFGSNDYDPMLDDGSVQSHGLAVAGISSAATDNDLGIASIGFNSKFIPIKITNESGIIVNSNDAFVYAALSGSKVINCSFGSSVYSASEEEIINYITDSLDVLVVASAGNDSEEKAIYPAALDKVLGVCALNETYEKMTISNYGMYYDISAPGSSMHSTSRNNQYATKGGTSMACALVSSAAILLRSHFTYESALQIKSRIQASSIPIHNNESYSWGLGYGRLHLLNAFNYTKPKSKTLHLFPNPSSETVNLVFEDALPGSYEISIYDVSGKLYYRNSITITKDIIRTAINVSHLASAHYIIELKGAEMLYSSSVVIVN